jgi:hypothetical protein
MYYGVRRDANSQCCKLGVIGARSLSVASLRVAFVGEFRTREPLLPDDPV